MSKKTLIKLGLDLAMTSVILFSLAYRVVGPVAHEWLGVSIFLLALTHNLMNWRWYGSLFNGDYRGRRLLNTTINLMLLAAITTLASTGILLSRNVFAFIHVEGTMSLRQIHTFTAYWGFMLISFHLGLHWGTIIRWVRKAAGLSEQNRLRTAISRVLVGAVGLGGIIAFIQRDMWPKLFRNYAFDAWNPDDPAIFLFAANLAIMGVCAAATYYGQNGLGRSGEGLRAQR